MTTIEKLLNYLTLDKDFKYVESNKEYIIDNIDLYTLDKKYLDIQYIVIDEVIFNLDELYFLCLEAQIYNKEFIQVVKKRKDEVGGMKNHR